MAWNSCSTRYRPLPSCALLCLSVFACEDGILVGSRLPPGADGGASGAPFVARAGSAGQSVTAGGSTARAGAGSSAGHAQAGSSDASAGADEQSAEGGAAAGSAGTAGIGGSAGSAGTAGAAAGSAGIGGSTGAAGAAAGSAGSAGAIVDPSAPWLLLEPLPPPQLPPGALPDEEHKSGTRILGATPDGRVLIGESYAYFPRFPFDPLGSQSRAFVWRKESGLKGLGELPFAVEQPLTRITPVAISSDGSRILGEYSVAVPGRLAESPVEQNWREVFAGLFQWSEKDGYQRIEQPGIELPRDNQVGFGSVSADARVALSYDGQKFYIWSAADGFRPIEALPNWPPGVGLQIALSRDGSSIVGAASGSPGSGNPDRLFRWRSSGLDWLGSLPDFPYCRGALITRDGMMIVGSCSNVDPQVSLNTPQRTFRWSEATGMIAAAPSSEVQLVPLQITDDGNAMVGIPYLGTEILDRLAAWTPANGITLVQGLKSDPSWKDFAADHENYQDSILSSQGGGTALQWTAAGGLRELEPLAPGETSWVWEQSLDGSLVCGSSHAPGGEVRAVFWDSLGVRNVVAEFETLNVDLQGYALASYNSVLGFAADDERVVMFGNTFIPGVGADRGWIGRLPLRH